MRPVTSTFATRARTARKIDAGIRARGERVRDHRNVRRLSEQGPAVHCDVLLAPEVRAELDDLARQRGVKRSEIVREAVVRLIEQEARAAS